MFSAFSIRTSADAERSGNQARIGTFDCNAHGNVADVVVPPSSLRLPARPMLYTEPGNSRPGTRPGESRLSGRCAIRYSQPDSPGPRPACWTYPHLHEELARVHLIAFLHLPHLAATPGLLHNREAVHRGVDNESRNVACVPAVMPLLALECDLEDTDLSALRGLVIRDILLKLFVARLRFFDIQLQKLALDVGQQRGRAGIEARFVHVGFSLSQRLLYVFPFDRVLALRLRMSASACLTMSATSSTWSCTACAIDLGNKIALRNEVPGLTSFINSRALPASRPRGAGALDVTEGPRRGLTGKADGPLNVPIDALATCGSAGNGFFDGCVFPNTIQTCARSQGGQRGEK